MSAEGAELIDARGDRYLDLLGGYGVFALGRNNPHVRDALAQALAARTANLPQLGVTLPAGLLAEELLARMPARIDAAVLSNSGAEAIEAALKLARIATGRPRVLFCERGFHGLTLGAPCWSTATPSTANAPGRCCRAARPSRSATSTRYSASSRAATSPRSSSSRCRARACTSPRPATCRLPRLCRRHGALLALDEIQTGLGRTGRTFAFERWDLDPDIVTVAKALSGGYVPIGATATSRAVFARVFDTMERAVVHSSTFAGNDLAAVAGLATLEASTARSSSSARAGSGSGCWS